MYVRYFTDREYESSEKSLAAALEIRDSMLRDMEQGCDFVTVCQRYRKSR